MYRMQVVFLGEAAVDTGGPRREFWSLIGKEASTVEPR